MTERGFFKIGDRVRHTQKGRDGTVWQLERDFPDHVFVHWDGEPPIAVGRAKIDRWTPTIELAFVSRADADEDEDEAREASRDHHGKPLAIGDLVERNGTLFVLRSLDGEGNATLEKETGARMNAPCDGIYRAVDLTHFEKGEQVEVVVTRRGSTTRGRVEWFKDLLVGIKYLNGLCEAVDADWVRHAETIPNQVSKELTGEGERERATPWGDLRLSDHVDALVLMDRDREVERLRSKAAELAAISATEWIAIGLEAGGESKLPYELQGRLVARGYAAVRFNGGQWMARSTACSIYDQKLTVEQVRDLFR